MPLIIAGGFAEKARLKKLKIYSRIACSKHWKILTGSMRMLNSGTGSLP